MTEQISKIAKAALPKAAQSTLLEPNQEVAVAHRRLDREPGRRARQLLRGGSGFGTAGDFAEIITLQAEHGSLLLVVQHNRIQVGGCCRRFDGRVRNEMLEQFINCGIVELGD
ncbi:MAG: hypothetical protein AB7G24_00875 [Novosphingobium sp.]